MEEGAINLPAGILVLVLMAILIIGVKLSSRVNLIAVIIKVSIVLFVIAAGVFYIERDNYSPFIPPSQPAPEAEGGFLDVPLIESIFGLEPAVFGWGGIVAGAAVVFFAFIGFDVVATTAEETRNPQRDVPIGILGALSICTVLYVTVSLVVTGMRSYTEIDPTDAAPLATAFAAVGRPGFADLISAGAIIGLVVVVMILLLGQSRVIFAMSRDGLLPNRARKSAPEVRHALCHHDDRQVWPWRLSHPSPRSSLAELVNVGTLFAFILVSIGVIVLRRTRPGPAASVQGPDGAGGADPGRAGVLLPDAQPDRDDVGAVLRLDGDRHRRVCRIRPLAQPAGTRHRAGGAEHREGAAGIIS